MQKRPSSRRNLAWERTIWTRLLGKPNVPEEQIPRFSTDESLIQTMVTAANARKITIDVVQEPLGSNSYFIVSPATKHGPLRKDQVPASLTGILAGILDVLGSPEFAEKDDEEEEG